ncbi:hypothetical protein [Mucilaginibacter calamicampi]|uniref:hypothetical protein n=1 Tax=Mucilaginibacter calamicampi TaxID=1302352 RepID=UPI00366CBABB
MKAAAVNDEFVVKDQGIIGDEVAAFGVIDIGTKGWGTGGKSMTMVLCFMGVEWDAEERKVFISLSHLKLRRGRILNFLRKFELKPDFRK